MPFESNDRQGQTQLMLHLHIDRRRAHGNIDLSAVICEFPEIVEGMKLSGDSGYWLRVSICQLDQYETLRERLLELLPDVQRITASVILDRLLPAGTEMAASCGKVEQGIG